MTRALVSGLDVAAHRDAFDLDLRSAEQSGADRGPRRLVGSEPLPINLVHCLEVGEVRQEDGRLRTRSSEESAETRTAARLSSTRRVWARTSSPPTSWPLWASSASCPAQNTRSPARIAWLYGPTGAGARSVLVTRRSICSPFCERAGHGARENLIILGQDAPQVECGPLVDDPRDDRGIRKPERLRQTAGWRTADRDGKGRLRLLGERPSSDGGPQLDDLGRDPDRGEDPRERPRPRRDRARCRGDHSPDRKLLLGCSIAVCLEGRQERCDGQLVGSERAHERVRAERGDGLGPTDRDPCLRSAEQLVSAEGDHVRTFADRLVNGELLTEAEPRRVEKGAAPEIVDESDAVLARES